jgi:hypothetical protein
MRDLPSLRANSPRAGGKGAAVNWQVAAHVLGARSYPGDVARAPAGGWLRVRISGVMRVAGIREIRAKTAELLSGDEPVLVTRHGKISGLYLPLEDANRLPQDLKRELGHVLSRHLARQLAAAGTTEKEIHEDFDAFRRSRR